MGLFDNEGQPKGPMNGEEAKKYVKRNGLLIPNPKKWCADDVECIDDRRKSSKLGYPGGAIGISATIFSGIDEGSRKKVGGFFGVANALERFFGGMSGHTDDHNHDHSFPCAGCGHLQAIRNSPDEYGLGSTYAPDFEKYVGEVGGRARNKRAGFNIFDYFGNHNARAVMHIDAVDDTRHIALPPNDGYDQVFVNNRGANRGILDGAQRMVQGIFGDVFSRDPKDVYDEQLGHTAKRLGADKLPHYSVSFDGEIDVK